MTNTRQTLIELIEQRKTLDAQIDGLKAQVHAEMLADGVKGDEFEGYSLILKAVPMSAAELKRNGWDTPDIPSEYVGEKVVPDIAWDKVKEHFNIPTTYTLMITRKKVK